MLSDNHQQQYDKEEGIYPSYSSSPTSQPMTPSPTPTVDNAYPTEKYDTKELETQQHEDLSSKHHHRRRRMENRSCCIRYLCCACCLPWWGAGIVWFIIIAIIIVVVVLAAIAGTFVMPTVDLAGVNSSNIIQQITFTDSTINIPFNLIVSINNPNLLSISLSDLNATAYYPNPNGGQTPIGSGYLASQFVPKYSHFNFTFPFAIQYDPSQDTDQSVLNDLVSKCGLTGGEQQDLTIDYQIKLTAKVLVIKVHPTISSSATFACPISNGHLQESGFNL
ncbi:MAG: hypothetical protein EXX96DRAFT_544726 [Benjaminiella poitrasii]|nr:MAG: hypothetical protein EXX96DRAFT_544726 [Benjaminiella poitrasii]